MRRGVLLALALAFVLVALVLAPVASVAQGDAARDGGRSALERMIEWASGGQVKLRGLTGAFPGAPRVERLEVHDAQGAWLVMEDVTIDWSPTALVRRRALIQTLSAARAAVTRLPEGGDAAAGGGSLPVRVEVEAFRIDRLELASAVTGLAQELAVAVSGSADIASLQEARFTLDARGIEHPATLQAEGRVTDAEMSARLTLDEPAQGLLSTVTALPDLGAIALKAEVEGPWNALALSVDGTAGQLVLAANGTLDLPASRMDLAVSANAPAMAPGPALSWNALALRARVTGDLTAPQVEGTMRLENLVAGATRLVLLTADIGGDAGQIRVVARAEGLTVPGPLPGLLRESPVLLRADADLLSGNRTVTLDLNHPRLRVTGEVDTGEVLAARLAVDLPDLAPLALDAQLAGSARLELDARLPAEGATVHASGTVRLAEAPLPAVAGETVEFTVQAAMRDGSVVVERLEATAGTTRLSATGTWSAAQVAADLTLQLPDLALVVPELRGAATLQATLRGPPDDLVLQAEVAGKAGTGRFPPLPLSATARVTGLPDAPSGSIEASATLEGAPLSLRAEASRDADGGLRVVVRQAAWKSATAEADMALPPDATLPVGTVRAQVGNLADFRPFIGGDLSGSVTATAQRDADGRLVARAEASGIGPVASLLLQAEGPAEAIVVRLSAKGDWTAQATATVNVPGEVATLSSLRASLRGETATLQGPAQIRFGDGVAVDRLRLALDGGSVQVAGRLSPTLDLTASLNGVPAAIARVAVPDLALDGTLQGEAKLTGTLAAPKGTARLSATALRLREGPAAVLPPANVTATATLAGNTARVEARATMGANQVNVAGSVPLGTAGALDLRASGRVSLALLDPLLTAEGRQVRGNVTLDATVTGPLADPQVAGTMRLAQGRVQDFGQGILVRDINGVVRATGGRLVVERMTGRAGPGTVVLTGSASIAAAPEIDLRLTAENARPIASDLVTAVLDADIALRGQVGATLGVAGRIGLRSVDIRLPERLPTTLPTLPIRRLGDTPPPVAEADPPEVELDLLIESPGRVYVRGRGLEAELEGRVRLGGTLADPQPEGALTLRRGTFNLLGTVLQLTEGSVRLEGGGQVDPVLDFTATTRVDTTAITVRITGNASSPEIKLSSTPELPQDEILALLLLGRSMAQLNPVQIAQVAAGLAELTGADGGFDPLGRLRAGLGLDRLSVGAAERGGATVEAGRNIGNGVYLGLKQGTGGSGPQATVQIDLGYGLKLQGEIGTTAGAPTATGSSGGVGSGLGVAWSHEY